VRIFWVWLMVIIGARDRCEICSGSQRGIYGEERIVDGKMMCFYCRLDREKIDGI